MIRRLSLIAAVALFPALSWAIPTEINYQGTVKEGIVPVNGRRNMLFRITNHDSTQVYWSKEYLQVPINNGYFSVKLTPGNIDWENITPYIELSIGDTRLSPAEPISATAYAAISANVVNGAITTRKLAPDVQTHLVPKGAIMMFALAECPSGWERFEEMDGRFPRGATSFGERGGADTHTHNLIEAPHTHSVNQDTVNVAIGMRNVGNDNQLVMKPGKIVGNYSAVTATQWYGFPTGMSNPAPIGSNPGDLGIAGPELTGTTGPATFSGESRSDERKHVPSYLGVLFCKKS
jgi:hypothetical protein